MLSHIRYSDAEVAAALVNIQSAGFKYSPSLLTLLIEIVENQIIV